MSSRAYSVEELALVVETLPNPACIVRQGVLVAANQALSVLSGQPLGGLVGMPAAMLIPTPDHDRVRALHASLPPEEVPQLHQLGLHGRDGSLLELIISRVLRRASDGGSPFVLVSITVLAQHPGASAFMRALSGLTASLLSVHGEPAVRTAVVEGLRAQGFQASFALPTAAAWGAQGLPPEELAGARLARSEAEVRFGGQELGGPRMVYLPLEGHPDVLVVQGAGLEEAGAGVWALFARGVAATLSGAGLLDAAERRNAELVEVARLARLAAEPEPPALELLLGRVRSALSADAVVLSGGADRATFRVGDDGFAGAPQGATAADPGWCAGNVRLPVGEAGRPAVEGAHRGAERLPTATDEAGEGDHLAIAPLGVGERELLPTATDEAGARELLPIAIDEAGERELLPIAIDEAGERELLAIAPVAVGEAHRSASGSVGPGPAPGAAGPDVEAAQPHRVASGVVSAPVEQGGPSGPQSPDSASPSDLGPTAPGRSPSGFSTPLPGTRQKEMRAPSHVVELELGDGHGWRLEVLGSASLAGEGRAQLLSMLADILRSALGQRRLREEAARQLGETRLLLDLARTTAGTLDTESILDVACDFLARLLDVTGVLIFLHDDRSGRLVGAAATEQNRATIREVQLRLDAPGITTRVAREREIVSIEDVPASQVELNAELFRRYGGKALLGLPLMSREELMGVVTLIDERGPRRFTAQQRELAQATVGQLALSIANARLYESLWRSYADLAATRAEMVKRERLAALGELSAIVAHEVRNPLGVIFNAVSSLRQAGLAKGDAGMLVDILAEESDRLNRIVGDLLDFSRPRQLDLEQVEIEELVEEALDVARAMPRDTEGAFTFRVELEPGLGRVSVDRRLFRQALVNVLLNAQQSMPRGGEVHVRARAVPPPGSGGLVLEVVDAGAGIAPELRARIFQPFFTTKARGTGLGLAVVKRIVEDHRGEVSLDSKLGSGTTFTFRLPWAGPFVDLDTAAEEIR